MTESADVVICGAGIAGVATAYFLAEKTGVRDVLLVDRRAPLTLTSDKSTECYRNWWPDPVMVRFMNRSIDLLESLARATDNAFGLNRRGYAYVTTCAEGVSELRRTAHSHAALGLGPIRVHGGTDGHPEPYTPSPPEGFEDAPPGADLLLDRDLIRRFYPYLSREVKAILHPRRCGWFSAQQMGMALLEEARRLGVRELRGEVVGVELDERGVCAVQIASDGGVDTVATRRFVNAAGPFVRRVGALLGVEVPVQTVLHQKIAIRDHLGVVDRSAPMLILVDEQYLDWSDEEAAAWRGDPAYRWLLDKFPAGVHLRPEGGRDSPWIIIVWGYATNPQQPVWEPELSPEFPEIALRGAAKLVPGLARYVGRMPTPVMHDGGYYTQTRENLPLIGPLGAGGAFVVGALSGYGLMAACAAGELGAAWVVGGELPDYAEALSLARYEDPSYVASLESWEPAGEL